MILILKARTGLVAKKVVVTRAGKTYQTTVYVRAKEKEKKEIKYGKYGKRKEIIRKNLASEKEIKSVANANNIKLTDEEVSKVQKIVIDAVSHAVDTGLGSAYEGIDLIFGAMGKIGKGKGMKRYSGFIGGDWSKLYKKIYG